MVAALPREGTLTLELSADRVDSSFLQLLVALAQEVEQRGLRVRARNDDGLVRELCLRLGGERVWRKFDPEVTP
jgi:anti-anti-sigma regulatory factor